MTEFLGTIFKGLGGQALKQLRRASAEDRLQTTSQLFVIQPDHWLFPALCQYKRHRHERRAAALQRKGGKSLDQIKNSNLKDVLARGQGGAKVPDSELGPLSERVLEVACAFSSQLPQFEPFLVEVGVAHCIREWFLSKRSATDIDGFTAFLQGELSGEAALDWFHCQFFIDTEGLLALSPMFYKERITNQAVKDIIALCFAESSNDLWGCSHLLVKRLAKEKNKAALDAWMVWVGDEFATVGSPSRGTAGSSSLYFMSRHLTNSTQLVANKRGYLPIGIYNSNFSTEDRFNLCGVMLDQKPGMFNAVKFGCSIYEGAATKC